MRENTARTAVGADGNEIRVGDRVHVDGEWGYEVLRIYQDGKVDVCYLKTGEVVADIFVTKVRLSSPPKKSKVFSDNKRPSLRIGDYIYHHEIGECTVKYLDRAGEEWKVVVCNSKGDELESMPLSEFDLAGGIARETLYGAGEWLQSSRYLALLNCPQQERLIDFPAAGSVPEA